MILLRALYIRNGRDSSVFSDAGYYIIMNLVGLRIQGIGKL